MDGFNLTSTSIWEIIQSQKKKSIEICLMCLGALISFFQALNMTQSWMCLVNLTSVLMFRISSSCWKLLKSSWWLDDCSLYRFESFVWVKNRGLEFGGNIFNMECSLSPVMRGECISLFRLGKWLQEMTFDINGTGEKFTFHGNNCF